jgi:hypothetical protein
VWIKGKFAVTDPSVICFSKESSIRMERVRDLLSIARTARGIVGASRLPTPVFRMKGDDRPNGWSFRHSLCTVTHILDRDGDACVSVELVDANARIVLRSVPSVDGGAALPAARDDADPRIRTLTAVDAAISSLEALDDASTAFDVGEERDGVEFMEDVLGYLAKAGCIAAHADAVPAREAVTYARSPWSAAAFLDHGKPLVDAAAERRLATLPTMVEVEALEDGGRGEENWRLVLTQVETTWEEGEDDTVELLRILALEEGDPFASLR